MILGAVLTGGRSSRFGSDKAAATWQGQALADHAAAAIGQFSDEVVFVGGDGGVPDLPAPGLGPLGGIAGALVHARARDFVSVLTIGCDMPSVPPALLVSLLRRSPAYCEDAPVLGHWPATLGPRLIEWIGGEDRSVRGWARMIGAVPIAAPGPLGNVNTPADLDALAPDGDMLAL